MSQNYSLKLLRNIIKDSTALIKSIIADNVGEADLMAANFLSSHFLMTQ